MVNTRSNDSGLIPNLVPMETQIVNLTSGLPQLTQMFQNLEERLNNGEGPSQRRDTGGHNGANTGCTYERLTKIEFPKFDGEYVLSWLYRVNNFFDMDNIVEDEQKIRLVSMHMFGKALNWHLHFMSKFGEVMTWPVYQTHVKKIFESVFEDPIMELKNLKHTTSVQVYQDSFEALLNKVNLDDSCAISLFIGGLKEEIAYAVRMFKPTSLTEVFSLAKLQEASNSVTKGKHSASFGPTKNTVFGSTNQRGGGSGTRIMPVQSTTMYSLEIVAYEEEWNNVDCEIFEQENMCEEEIMPQVSLNAMTGVPSYQTMRVKSHVKKQVLHILVDCGSTHNFLYLHAAKRMGCNLSKMCPLQVSVANGQVMSSVFQCKNFKWTIRGQVFETDVMILPLGGCEMVLGIQWLATLGVIQFDFKILVMDFMINGKRCVLRGTPLQWMQGKHVSNSLNQMGVEFSNMALCVCPATLMHMTGSSTKPNSNIQTLLQDFSIVFDTPKDLPPIRSHDHIIPLLPNTPPISVRPYKHPPNQKDAIELMVKELLKAGVIRNSQSSFSSPIVMVKKKDGTWRMCMDYRMLNKYTVKDKFPIPIIEELLDELYRAKVFSKLDLRSGYHQIRMNHGEIHKTAFRTHKGHYEFLVMPFGLTNAPSTFKSLMNTVFKPYLRKFVLVFFDDISVYSKTRQVEYLGHIITKEGVLTDPTKIQAMESWPIPQTVKQLRGFLGLTGYYRKFIKNYAWISKSLTNLLKKDAFVWSPEARESFLTLKQAMIQTPVLALPDFKKTFVVETNASGIRIDLVLQKIIDELVQSTSADNKYKWEGGLLKRKGKIVVGTNEQLRTTIIQHYHADAVGGHSGTTVTAHKVELKVSTAYHPQTDGQTEVVNKCLECYLRCMTRERPKEWVQWLPLAKFWYNTNKHSSTKISPYEAVYGQTPPLHTPYVAGESTVESVDRSLQARENAIEMLKFHIKRSQDRMKKYADLKRSKREFDVGMWVYVKLQPHRQVTIRHTTQNKLSLKYYKPFLIVAKVELVAYKLDLPSGSQVHPVFHVSQLKLCKGNSFKKGLLPRCGEEGLLSVEPEKILDKRIGKVNNRAVVYVLVKWINHSEEDATWELAEDLSKRFPEFSLDP
nr:hypothetical protein [Tanacetum cinerariifolium]